jgi:hypothetical protein
MGGDSFIGSRLIIILLAGSAQEFVFPKGDRGQVPRGGQATARESWEFPPILSRQVRDAPPAQRIFRYPFHSLDGEKSLIFQGTLSDAGRSNFSRSFSNCKNYPIIIFCLDTEGREKEEGIFLASHR